MAAMEFQDLTSQHIDRTVSSVADVYERLRNVLAIFDLQVREVAAASNSPIGSVRPFVPSPSRADSIPAGHR